MIINPIFFYLMQISENIGMAMKIGGPSMIILSIPVFMIAADVFCSEETEKKLYRLGKCMIPAGIIIFVIGLLVPNKDTLLLMQAAKLTTTDNVNAVFEALKAAMDYAVTILK